MRSFSIATMQGFDFLVSVLVAQRKRNGRGGICAGTPEQGSRITDVTAWTSRVAKHPRTVKRHCDLSRTSANPRWRERTASALRSLYLILNGPLTCPEIHTSQTAGRSASRLRIDRGRARSLSTQGERCGRWRPRGKGRWSPEGRSRTA